jgi:hypothetical protein
MSQLTPAPDLPALLAAAKPGDKWLLVDGTELVFKSLDIGYAPLNITAYLLRDRTGWLRTFYAADGRHAGRRLAPLAGPEAYYRGSFTFNLPPGVAAVPPITTRGTWDNDQQRWRIHRNGPAEPATAACDHGVVDSGLRRAWCRCGLRAYEFTLNGWQLVGERRQA